MTKQLRLEEMRDCATDTGDPELVAKANAFASKVSALGQEFGQVLAAHFGVICGQTAFEPEAFAGCCTEFYAKEIGQPCPEAMRNYDATEWTTQDFTDLNPETGARWTDA